MDSLSAATAAELGEVSFQLPAEPLAATLALLLASTRELQRAGGPQLPPLARQCLAGELQVSPPPHPLNSTVPRLASSVSQTHIL